MSPTSLTPTHPRGDGDRADPTDPAGPASPASYEQLRHHLARPRREHPAARQHPAAPTAPRGSGVSMTEWLLAVARAVVRRVRRAPHSALARLHPPR